MHPTRMPSSSGSHLPSFSASRGFNSRNSSSLSPRSAEHLPRETTTRFSRAHSEPLARESSRATTHHGRSVTHIDSKAFEMEGSHHTIPAVATRCFTEIPPVAAEPLSNGENIREKIQEFNVLFTGYEPPKVATGKTSPKKLTQHDQSAGKIIIPSRHYHSSPSVIHLRKISQAANPIQWIEKAVGSQVEKIKKFPKVIAETLLVEHVLREKGFAVGVQNTIQPILATYRIITKLCPDTNLLLRRAHKSLRHLAPAAKPKDVPFMKLRSKATTKTVGEVVELAKDPSFKDWTPEMREVMLSVSYGLITNLTPEESALQYWLKNSNLAGNDKLLGTCEKLFVDACISRGATLNSLEKDLTHFRTLLAKYFEVGQSSPLVVGFKPEIAREIGYNARPLGVAASNHELDKVLPHVYDSPEAVADVSPQYGPQTQARLVATPKLLDPHHVMVVNTSDPDHLRFLGVNRLVHELDVPSSLKPLIGSKVTETEEEKTQRRHLSFLKQESEALVNGIFAKERRSSPVIS